MNPNPKSQLGTLCLLLIVTAASTIARADTNCVGNVSEYLVSNDGMLMIQSTWRDDWTVICNVQTPWKGVSTESCFTWFGIVTTARTLNKPISIYYSGDAVCAALPTYAAAPAPYYVRLRP